MGQDGEAEKCVEPGVGDYVMVEHQLLERVLRVLTQASDLLEEIWKNVSSSSSAC